MTNIAIVYHSGFGHTATVAEEIAKGVADGGATPVLVKLDSAGQDFSEALQAVTDADGVVFGAPTYMGDVSAVLKTFFEASGKIWYTGGWKDKVAGGFTNSFNASGDKLHALQSIFVLAMQHHMIWVGAGQPAASAGKVTPDYSPDQVNRFSYSIGVATQSDNAGADVTPGAGDKEFARRYGVRLAELTRKLRGTP
jgi:NAD(P)H dehydrogenase (quinone)